MLKDVMDALYVVFVIKQKKIEVNNRLNHLKHNAKERLLSEKGLEHRSKRPIEVEAVFGQLKNNNKFNRFTFKGLEKVEMEFILMAIGHNFRKMMVNEVKNNPKSSKNNQNSIQNTIDYQFKMQNQKFENVIVLNFKNYKIAT